MQPQFDRLDSNVFNQFRGERGAYLPALHPALASMRFATDYQPRQLVVPDITNASIVARGVYEGRFTVLPETMLWAISGFSTQAAGCRVQITDIGTRQTLWPQPVNLANCSGGNGTTAQGMRNQQWFLPKPWVFVEPGLIAVKIFNLATVANAIELVLFTLEPTYARPTIPAGI